ncbi:unnamed protein product [Acanthoscelides obtectus]|uniref:Uncharacterized protein n=1 Tax=Acanthoscelides obtectus TaxID=200917 RepID=A0A9P0LHY6_ACAOB|nr:unnamed protein product [Acanthoscelides obtectus]CAK1630892.1 hypothetical protein AOBTE_LOCUS6620 [Acanthoscelides obtectus]
MPKRHVKLFCYLPSRPTCCLSSLLQTSFMIQKHQFYCCEVTCTPGQSLTLPRVVRTKQLCTSFLLYQQFRLVIRNRRPRLSSRRLN